MTPETPDTASSPNDAAPARPKRRRPAAMMVATFGMSAASLLVSFGYLGNAPRGDFESLAKDYSSATPRSSSRQ